MDEILKTSFMMKRSQGKRKGIFKVQNFKMRWFILTTSTLSYNEGSETPERIGKRKGVILLNRVRFIEAVDDAGLDKSNAFQIGYFDGSRDLILYVIANTDGERQEWLSQLRNLCKNNRKLSPVFHSGVYSSGRWSCCDKITRHDHGCEATTPILTSTTALDTNRLIFERIRQGRSGSLGRLSPEVGRLSPEVPTKLSPRQGTRANYERSRSASRDFPQIPLPYQQPGRVSPTRIQRKVIALYDYRPLQPSDLALYKGDCYDILDDSKPNWWLARAEVDRQEGWIPSNYVQTKTEAGLEQYDWYARGLPREQCEELLSTEGREGCFLVRDSSTKGLLTVSIFTKYPQNAVRHYHIKTLPDGRYYLSEKYPFNTIPELIAYHKHNAGGLVSRLCHPVSSDIKLAPPTGGLGHGIWEIHPSELTLLSELGSGQFGVVKKGVYKNRIEVAVKMLKEGTMSEDDFIEEAKFMTELQHPNLVQLYGVVTKKRPIMIITEFMRHGSLLSYLRHNTGYLTSKPGLMLEICLQVCSAMSFLETKSLIHRDLAARNCLVGVNHVVKVADFGLSRYVVDDEYVSCGRSKFPIKWSPPEVLTYARFSSKSDVWSFGVLMWEVYSFGKMPYAGMPTAEYVQIVTNGYRMDRPIICKIEVYRLMRNCWEYEPENRPNFATLLEQLENCQADLEYAS